MIFGPKQTVKFSFIELFLPIFYILAQYSYGVSNIGLFILIIHTIFCLITRSRLLIHKPLVIFVLFISAIQICNMALRGNLSLEDFNNLFNPILMILILSTALFKINYNNLYKVYAVFGFIAMIILFYQWFMMTMFGLIPSPVTLFPIESEGFYSWQNEYYRPSSLFTEPQAFASYMLPLLLMTLHRDKILFSFLIILSIIFSGSSLGIFLVLTVLIVYLIKLEKGWAIKIALSFLILSIVYVSISSDIFDSQIAKILSIDLSNNIRLVKGFQIISTFDGLQMFFGIGHGPKVLEAYNNLHFIELSHMDIFDLGPYVTTISGVLISYGVFSLIVFFVFTYRMYRYEDPTKRIFLLVIFVAAFGQTILFNGFFLLYYIVYLGICNKSIYNKNYIYILSKQN